MTELQRAEFEMLKEFVRICDELQLTYYLVCGSALGAAKYGGFIPWDDDIDVALPRADYEIFCENAQKLLPNHLFLQNHRTDKYYHLIFSKIRNSCTTFVEKSYAKTNINHGIYIDVFPLDGYPEDVKLQQCLEKEKRRYSLMRLCCLNIELSYKSRILVLLEKICGVHKNPSKFVNRLERYIKQYPVDESKVWCNHGNWQGILEYSPHEQYGKGIFAQFEGLRVRIPEKIDEYLTQKYGDWRADPPLSEKKGHHYHYICDTKRSYKDYIEKATIREVRFKK